MAKKFFYNRVHNTKRTIINVVIIGVCIIGVIICFLITSNFQGENKNPNTGELSIKDEATIEINDTFTNEIFFSKIENVNLDDIKVKYPDDYDVSKAGRYDVTLEINGKKYNSTLVVVDTIKPELTLKEVTINENETYTARDFVDSCSDNSNKDCAIEFYKEGIDEDGNSIDYSKYKDIGTYAIKVAATDKDGNQTVNETKLTINAADSNPETNPNTDPNTPETPEQPQVSTCKYGNNEYDKENYLIAVDITTNGCAVSLDLYKSNSMTTNINKIMESETTRIKKDVNALNLKGTVALNRKVTAVINTSGNGIVGYELQMTLTINNNNTTETIAEYKVNSNGKRVFTKNPHNLAE